MKLLKADKGRWVFELAAVEKALLTKVLSLYPMVPAEYPKLSRGQPQAEDQKLLEEALAGVREENKQRVAGFLQARGRFRPGKEGEEMHLKRSELDWLLQILNDVRVGSWVRLGSPEGPRETMAALNENTAPLVWGMQVSGNFQMFFLAAMSGDPPAPPEKPSAGEA